MKLKKFTAKTMPEAMQQIRSELGRDAVILRSKEVKKGGVLGLFQQTHIEVVAAIDPDTEHAQRVEKRKNTFDHHPVTNEQTNRLSIREDDSSQLLAEIKQMKQLLQLNQSSTPIPPMFEADYVLSYTYLLEQEVDSKIAADIVSAVQQRHLSLGEDATAQKIKEAIKNELTKHLDDRLWKQYSFHERVIHFIGPTGVGKTTTIAKIAAQAVLEKNKNVAFITTDTYRIAAIEQLKTYARILDIPIEVAYSKEDYVQALQKHSNVDHIFVDTAGRNFREQPFVEELTEWIMVNEDSQATMLVLSLSTKQSDLVAIFNQFQHLRNQRVIFTKLDETNQFGAMINFAINEHAEIAFVTNGQDVPQDVVEADATIIASYVMSESNDQ